MDKLSCAKCGSLNVEYHPERRTWSNRDPERVFHCVQCGLVLYGEKADKEVERQAALIKVAPKTASKVKPIALLPKLPSQSSDRLRAAIEDIRVRCTARLEHLKGRLNYLRERFPLDRIEDLTFKGVVNILKIEINKYKAVVDSASSPDASLLEVHRLWDRVSDRDLDLKIEKAISIGDSIQKGRTVPLKLVVPSKDSSLCSWKDCQDPRREGSIYCSTKCKDRNARWNHAQRKLAASSPTP